MSALPKKYVHTNIDGEHWPDANVGDNLFYSLDLSCWVNSENELIESIEWTMPEGVTSEESFVTHNISHVKIHTPILGSFKISGKLVTSEFGLDQTNNIYMILKVY